ncbi:MAG: hypothetical protein ACPLQO_07385, partial [Desulfotomaculales bacterium]
EALEAFFLLARTEGILPALESAHALAQAAKLAPALGPGGIIVVNLSGRGDKDVETVFRAGGLPDERRRTHCKKVCRNNRGGGKGPDYLSGGRRSRPGSHRAAGRGDG